MVTLDNNRKEIRRRVVTPSKMHINKSRDIEIEKRRKEAIEKKKRLDKEKAEREKKRLEEERIRKEKERKEKEERLKKEQKEKEKAERERLKIVQEEMKNNELKEEIKQENEERLQQLRKEMEQKMRSNNATQFVSSVDDETNGLPIETIPVETRRGRHQNQQKYGKISDKHKMIANGLIGGVATIALVVSSIWGFSFFKNYEINKINGSLSTEAVSSKDVYIKAEGQQIPDAKNLPFNASEEMVIKEKYQRFNQSLTRENKQVIVNKILQNTSNPSVSQILASSNTKGLKANVKKHIIGTISIPSLNVNEDIINGITDWNAIYGVSAVLPYNVLGYGNITLTGANTGHKDTLLSNLVATDGKSKLSEGDSIFLKANGKVKAQYKVKSVKTCKVTPDNSVSTKFGNKLTLIVNNKTHFNNKNERIIIMAEKTK